MPYHVILSYYEGSRGINTVSEKVVTVSARISGEHLGILEKLSSELELSKTDVIQKALELLGQMGTGSASSTVTITIPRDVKRRAAKLVHDKGIASSIPELLEKAVEPGLDALISEYIRRRQNELELERVASEADAMDIQTAALNQR